jgi:hypothetical protein
MHSIYSPLLLSRQHTVINNPIASVLGFLILLAIPHAASVETVVDSANRTREAVITDGEAGFVVGGRLAFATFATQFEVFLSEGVGAHEFLGVSLALPLDVDEALIVLVGIVGEIVIALDLVFDVLESSQIGKAEVVLVYGLKDCVVCLSVCGHN